MLTNFNNAFKDNKKNKTEIPQKIVEVLNRKIPSDFEYKQVDNGVVAIIPKDRKALTFSTKIKLPDIPERIRSEIHNINDLYEYLYRTQKKCEVVPDKCGNIKVNNKKINLNDIVRNVMTDSNNSKIELIPPEFPEPVKIKIRAGDIYKEFHMKRQPYESMNDIYIKSAEEKPICIKMYLKKNENVDFNISINIDDISSVREIVNICEFYRSVMVGNIYIEGARITDIKQNKSCENEFLNEKIGFWKKALSIEQLCKCKFNAQKLDDEKDYIVIQRLYKSLIENKPYKIRQKYNSMTVNDLESYDKYKEFENTTILLEYVKEVKYEIMGVEMKIYIMERIYNCHIEEVNREENVLTIKFGEYEKYKTFVARKCFMEKKDLEEEQMNRKEDHKDFENAELI